MIALFLTPMIGAKKYNLNENFYNHACCPTTDALQEFTRHSEGVQP